METTATSDAVARLREVTAGTPGLRLLLLYGSRARGTQHAGSDWDLGYLAGPAFDPFDLLDQLTRTLRTDDVDLVDLDRASGLLRFRAASDGMVVIEAVPDAYHDFAVAAARYWYDVEPVVRRAHDDILRGLG